MINLADAGGLVKMLAQLRLVLTSTFDGAKLVGLVLFSGYGDL